AFLSQSATTSALVAGEIKTTLPGPTGELNTYSTQPRGHILVLHPDSATRRELAQIAKKSGNTVTESAVLPPDCAENFDAVMTRLDDDSVFSSLAALRAQPGERIIPVISDQGGYIWLKKEKHICRDTTASGGNVDLLMS
ncbi:MAG: bifunctional proline dehydrogenase/L-glutamate gamma-semialdehyde dehydrogenase, partial [Proteobacteria bacterium]|nr:bifunctional proline dehydrogenase/L-glutamate gamma-semialdehyde dehydrogenase [Pseudomonadota bacterium]